MFFIVVTRKIQITYTWWSTDCGQWFWKNVPSFLNMYIYVFVSLHLHIVLFHPHTHKHILVYRFLTLRESHGSFVVNSIIMKMKKLFSIPLQAVILKPLAPLNFEGNRIHFNPDGWDRWPVALIEGDYQFIRYGWKITLRWNLTLVLTL